MPGRRIESKHVTFREDENLAPMVRAFEFEGKQFKLAEKGSAKAPVPR